MGAHHQPKVVANWLRPRNRAVEGSESSKIVRLPRDTQRAAANDRDDDDVDAAVLAMLDKH